jgi:hypothetical protein
MVALPVAAAASCRPRRAKLEVYLGGASEGTSVQEAGDGVGVLAGDGVF